MKEASEVGSLVGAVRVVPVRSESGFWVVQFSSVRSVWVEDYPPSWS